MKAGGRSRGRARDFSVDRLVVVVVVDLLLDVRRKRHLAKPLQHLEEDPLVMELHVADSLVENLNAGAGQRAIAEGYIGSFPDGMGVAY